MINILTAIFESLNFPYYMQGSFTENDELPTSFFTFWNINSDDDLFADNTNHALIWKWQVNFYTKDPAVLYSGLDQFITAAKNNGFLVRGKGQSLATNTAGLYARSIITTYEEFN